MSACVLYSSAIVMCNFTRQRGIWVRWYVVDHNPSPRSRSCSPATCCLYGSVGQPCSRSKAWRCASACTVPAPEAGRHTGRGYVSKSWDILYQGLAVPGLECRELLHFRARAAVEWEVGGRGTGVGNSAKGWTEPLLVVGRSEVGLTAVEIAVART